MEREEKYPRIEIRLPGGETTWIEYKDLVPGRNRTLAVIAAGIIIAAFGLASTIVWLVMTHRR